MYLVPGLHVLSTPCTSVRRQVNLCHGPWTTVQRAQPWTSGGIEVGQAITRYVHRIATCSCSILLQNLYLPVVLSNGQQYCCNGSLENTTVHRHSGPVRVLRAQGCLSLLMMKIRNTNYRKKRSMIRTTESQTFWQPGYLSR